MRLADFELSEEQLREIHGLKGAKTPITSGHGAVVLA